MTRRAYYGYMGVAVLALGAMPFFKKAAVEAGLGAYPLALVVALAAALGAWVLVRATGAPAYLPRRVWPHLALIGVLAAGVVVLINALALTSTSATNQSLFQAMYPSSTLLFAWLVLGERLRPAHYAMIVVMSLGVLLVNSDDGALALGAGFWLLLATLPIMGFCDAYAKRTMAQVGPDQVAVGRFAFGALLLVLLFPMARAGDWDALGVAWPWAALGGAMTALGVFALYRALRVQKAGVVGALVATAPVLTALLEATFLGQVFAPWQVAGVALVVAGAALLALRA
ncbi:EamA family transporter [Ectothiorhodospiraceae bacterium 2226]|nr:EamA family transporter [Ectothiorhodospiraceae bacterium 2226]